MNLLVQPQRLEPGCWLPVPSRAPLVDRIVGCTAIEKTGGTPCKESHGVARTMWINAARQAHPLLQSQLRLVARGHAAPRPAVLRQRGLRARLLPQAWRKGPGVVVVVVLWVQGRFQQLPQVKHKSSCAACHQQRKQAVRLCPPSWCALLLLAGLPKVAGSTRSHNSCHSHPSPRSLAHLITPTEDLGAPAAQEAWPAWQPAAACTRGSGSGVGQRLAVTQSPLQPRCCPCRRHLVVTCWQLPACVCCC